MPAQARMSPADRILDALTRGAPHGMSSAELCKATGLSVWHAYPALITLEKGGAISSEWEMPEPTFEPRRRLYWIAGGVA